MKGKTMTAISRIVVAVVAALVAAAPPSIAKDLQPDSDGLEHIPLGCPDDKAPRWEEIKDQRLDRCSLELLSRSYGIVAVRAVVDYAMPAGGGFAGRLPRPHLDRGDGDQADRPGLDRGGDRGRGLRALEGVGREAAGRAGGLIPGRSRTRL
jgi:hypothetical protein